jgi:four helix bundle protein
MARIQGDLKVRTFRFAQAVLDVFDCLPNNTKGWELGKQLIRSGTGVGSNVREADNAHTDAEFAHKCSIARKEAGETAYWLELCTAAGLLPNDRTEVQIQEADELTRILSAIVIGTQTRIEKTARETRP